MIAQQNKLYLKSRKNFCCVIFVDDRNMSLSYSIFQFEDNGNRYDRFNIRRDLLHLLSLHVMYSAIALSLDFIFTEVKI